MRIFCTDVNTAIALRQGQNNHTEIQLERLSRSSSKQTLVLFSTVQWIDDLCTCVLLFSNFGLLTKRAVWKWTTEQNKSTLYLVWTKASELADFPCVNIPLVIFVPIYQEVTIWFSSTHRIETVLYSQMFYVIFQIRNFQWKQLLSWFCTVFCSCFLCSLFPLLFNFHGYSLVNWLSHICPVVPLINLCLSSPQFVHYHSGYGCFVPLLWDYLAAWIL